MSGLKTVGIGMVGCGFVAELHAESYARVFGYDARIVAVAAPSKRRDAFASRHGIERTYDDLDELLADPAVDVVDICTPPALHFEMIRRTIAAGKHVICEKPLTGYFDTPYGASGVDRQQMYDQVMTELDALREVVKASGLTFCYAENYVYAPAVQKSRELLEKTRARVLLMRGEESHNGSHAPHAAHWQHTGGGSLIRQGCHPLSAMLYLKRVESRVHGTEVRVASVLGDAVAVSPTLTDEERRHIDARPVDVEDMGTLILGFSDGSRGLVTSCDVIVGGVRNLMEVFTNQSVHLCQLSPNDALRVYHSDATVLDDVYLTEKVDHKGGWQFVFLDELLMRGYLGEMQDFVECIATGRAPESDFDLAYDSIQALYAGYLSAASDRRVLL